MSVDLTDLQPAFLAKVQAGLAILAAQGLNFKPYFTLRDGLTQAKLWRQSRSAAVITQQITTLRDQHADYIADCLEAAGPQHGPWATNALPGLSWHQYGLAVDCFLEDANGRPDWNSPEYQTYGKVADAGSMYWGGHFGDHDHWQDSKLEPLEAYGSLSQISAALASISSSRNWLPNPIFKPIGLIATQI